MATVIAVNAKGASEVSPVSAEAKVKVGAAYVGEQVRVWFHSAPALLVTVALDAAKNTRVTIPSDAVLGDHKIVVQALDGSLIGWDAIKIGTTSQAGPNGEWLATTGADRGLVFLLLIGVVILVGAAKRRRGIAAGTVGH